MRYSSFIIMIIMKILNNWFWSIWIEVEREHCSTITVHYTNWWDNLTVLNCNHGCGLAQVYTCELQKKVWKFIEFTLYVLEQNPIIHVDNPCHVIVIAFDMVSLNPKALLVIPFSNSDLIVVEIQASYANLKQISYTGSQIRVSHLITG